ncbi:MAG: insulinase family protein [Candidatus Andersenbacteria bacterium]|nr:insulinase family protein [Candidatus Andersenbacteria bacterium]
MNIDSWTRKDGLRVVHVPYPDMDTVTVLALCKTGSKYETDEIAGISHFLEHMFFKGTEKRPTAQHVAEALDEVGGEFNAFTGKEYTGYYAKVADRHAELAVDVIGDILLHSNLDPREINRERGVIIEEMRMYQDSPMRYVPELLENELYPNQPAGRLIIGSEETIMSVKAEDFRDYLAKQYVSKNMVVVLVGNITKERVEALVDEHFADMPEGEAQIAMMPATETQTEPGLLLHYKETDQAHLALAFRGVARKHKDRAAHVVLSAILGGGMSSRLFGTVREQMGLAYYIRAEAESMTETGYIEVSAGVEVTKLQDALIAILKECEGLVAEEVPAKELKKAKEYIKGRSQLGLEKSDEIAFFVGEQEILEHEVELLEEKFAKIDAVTAADVQRVAKDVFVNEKMNLAVIGPYRDPAPVMDVLTF